MQSRDGEVARDEAVGVISSSENDDYNTTTTTSTIATNTPTPAPTSTRISTKPNAIIHKTPSPRKRSPKDDYDEDKENKKQKIEQQDEVQMFIRCTFDFPFSLLSLLYSSLLSFLFSLLISCNFSPQHAQFAWSHGKQVGFIESHVWNVVTCLEKGELINY